MRFSLKWLLIAVAFVAVGLVALINANSVWREGLETVAAIMLLVAIVGAIASLGERRLYWLGYILFGGVFFVTETGMIPILQESQLLPNTLWSYAHQQAVRPKQEELTRDEFENIRDAEILVRHSPLSDDTLTVTLVRPSRQAFVEVGNALLCIPFGLLGGVVASAFYRRRTPVQKGMISNGRV